MKQEKFQRSQIKHKKEEEKNKAETELYRELEVMEKKNLEIQEHKSYSQTNIVQNKNQMSLKKQEEKDEEKKNFSMKNK